MSRQNKHYAALMRCHELCSCKVSLVLCQITGFTACVPIPDQDSITDRYFYKSKLASAHRDCATPQLAQQERLRTELIHHGLYFLYLLPGVSYSISPGSHSVAYVQQLRGT